MSFWDSFRKFFTSAETLANPDIDIDEFEKIIGYNFSDHDLLLLCLTHRSFYQNDGGREPANERLEFLGDSVLGMVISHRLYNDHPELREGELTKTKAQLVNENALALVGKKVGLNRFIRMSAEEQKAGGNERPSIVSDAFESVIAGVYLDGGVEAARDMILRLIYVHKDELIADESQRNFKGELLERVQARGDGMPRYDVIEESGPDHDKTFVIEVYIDEKLYGSGQGNSKKEAEQKAASEALQQYFPE